MIIVLHNRQILIWGVPPLSPHHPPDFHNDNPTHISPLLKTSLPDDITRNSKRIRWEMILDWYADSLQSIHLGVSTEVLNMHHVEIVIKPDLSDISLHVIHTWQLAPGFHTILWPQYHIFEDYTHVSQAYVMNDRKGKMHIWSTSSRPPNVISPESPITLTLSLPGALLIPSPSSASGRFVYVPRNPSHDIVVVDFLKYV